MVALIRPHEIRPNNTPTDETTAALQIGSWCHMVHQFLIGTLNVDDNGLGLWSVLASSNGATLVVSAADNMTGPASWITAAAGVAHSWCIYESDDTGVQLMIDLSLNSTEQIRFVLARPGSVFSLAGLSTLNAPANPTSALEQLTTSYRQVLENNPTLFGHTVHLWRDAEGSFIIATAQNGTNVAAHALAFLVLEVDGSGDADVALYPYFFNCARFSSTGGAFFRTVLDNGGSYLAANMWWSDGSTVTGIIDSRNVLSQSGAGGTVGGRLPRFRVECYNNVVGRVAYRGYVPDLGVIAGSPTTNDLETGSDPVRRVVLGNWDLLTNGATLLSL